MAEYISITVSRSELPDISKVNTTLTVIDSRPRLVLSDGSSCKAPDGSDLGLKASTIIEFICDTSIFGTGQPRLVGQLPPGDDDIGCFYVIQWGTHVSDSSVLVQYILAQGI